MVEWVYPLGSAAHAGWDVAIGTSQAPVRDAIWQHTGLAVTTLEAGASIEMPAAAEERIVVPLNGGFDVKTDDGDYRLRGRASVFSGPTDVLYTGTDTRITITSEHGGKVAVTTAPAAKHYPARLILAEDVPVLMRGDGNCLRQVHNFGMPEALEADRLLVCEVMTPAGNWSSYPPHKHDVDNEGETALEEIYYYEVAPAEGMPVPAAVDPIGYQRVYASDERPIDVCTEIRSGDVVLVPYGWHGPVMATPGYDLYYLNVMAGPGKDRDWLISDDPHHGWIRKTWQAPGSDVKALFTSGQQPKNIGSSQQLP